MVGWKWWVVSQQVVFVCLSAILGRVTFTLRYGRDSVVLGVHPI